MVRAGLEKVWLFQLWTLATRTGELPNQVADAMVTAGAVAPSATETSVAAFAIENTIAQRAPRLFQGHVHLQPYRQLGHELVNSNLLTSQFILRTQEKQKDKRTRQERIFKTQCTIFAYKI